MDPTEARGLLLAQHECLRALLASAHGEAKRVIAGAAATGLHEILVELRRAFAEHNASEEALLEPILRRDPAWGTPRIDRMLEEHAGEHLAFQAALSGTDHGVAAGMADLCEEVEAHMAAEERTFLSPGVLCRDVVGRDGP